MSSNRSSMSSNRRPHYARALRLRRLRPGELLCFLFFEGSILLGVLLALAELVPWWGVLVIPIVVALLVKVHDMVTAANAQAAFGRPPSVHRTGTGVQGTGTGIQGTAGYRTRGLNQGRFD